MIFFEIPTSWFNRIMSKSLENQNWDVRLLEKCYADQVLIDPFSNLPMEFMVRLIDPFNVFPVSVLSFDYYCKDDYIDECGYGMALNMRVYLILIFYEWVPEFVEGKFMGILMCLTFIFEICQSTLICV